MQSLRKKPTPLGALGKNSRREIWETLAISQICHRRVAQFQNGELTGFLLVAAGPLNTVV